MARSTTSSGGRSAARCRGSSGCSSEKRCNFVGSGGVPTENAWGRNWSVAQRTLAHIYTLWIVSRNRFLRETR
ncbi:hypothetical protein PAHAL_5G324500 [Panicum hallii]|uniref:Uncharacterized protein n=1 Tax=Panicum hallii TaxID=206008 RepID=A0A2S3HV94_9POAL|nr:hypothetical protein PAHAL_5G324500 [Panicum hallii]